MSATMPAGDYNWPRMFGFPVQTNAWMPRDTVILTSRTGLDGKLTVLTLVEYEQRFRALTRFRRIALARYRRAP